MSYVPSTSLARYEPPEFVLGQGFLDRETCRKCSSTDVAVGFKAQKNYRSPSEAYRNAEGEPFLVYDEHLKLTCKRCHFEWPRRCHDTPGGE